MPGPWVVDHQTRSIYLEISDKLAARAFVPVGGLVQPAIQLEERLELKTWEAQPGSIDLGAFTDSKVQTADGNQIGRWTEIKIYIDATQYSWLFYLIQPPAVA